MGLMIRNRTAQLVFQTAYCALALVGLAASLGVFDARFDGNFYVYFTNLSNYMCMIIMFAELISTIKYANKKEDGYCKTLPLLKFMGLIVILITFFVFNILLADENTINQLLSVYSLLFHVVLPILFIADWFLFYERRKLKWYYPLLGLLVPLVYLAFIFIRADILNGFGAVIYPYFFLNVNNLGWEGVLRWIGILFLIFLAVGYIFYLFDKIIKSPKQKSE